MSSLSQTMEMRYKTVYAPTMPRSRCQDDKHDSTSCNCSDAFIPILFLFGMELPLLVAFYGKNDGVFACLVLMLLTLLVSVKMELCFRVKNNFKIFSWDYYHSGSGKSYIL